MRNLLYRRVNCNFVFPFKFSPHCSELHISTACWRYIIHNVNVYIIKNYDVLVRCTWFSCNIIDNVSKDNASFR